MIGDSSARDQAAPPLDPQTLFDANTLYTTNRRIPYIAVSQSLLPAPTPSILNVFNSMPIMVQQQLGAQTSQTRGRMKLHSFGTRLAWVPQTTTAPSS